MNASMNSRMELVALAHRRYPDMELPFAVECLRSDRKHAGLGALDERRRHGSRVSNIKYWSLTDGRIFYRLLRDTPARREFPRLELPDYPSATAPDYVTLVNVPARKVVRMASFDPDEFHDQRGRKYISETLRMARRDLRAAK